MGGRSGGSVRGGLQPGDFKKKKSDIKNAEDLKNIKDRVVYNEMKSAISRFYKYFGIPERKIKLADMPDGTYGVTVMQGGKTEGVYLQKKLFKNKTKAEIEAVKKKGYKSGWATKTNKPIAHTITHELAHTVWNDSLKSAKHQAAGKEITKVYHTWLKDKKKSGYGDYAKTNVSEFFAETITKGSHGKSDKYTKALTAIVAKHKLNK